LLIFSQETMKNYNRHPNSLLTSSSENKRWPNVERWGGVINAELS